MDLPDYLSMIEKANEQLLAAEVAISPELKDKHIAEAKSILFSLSRKISGHREYFRDLYLYSSYNQKL